MQARSCSAETCKSLPEYKAFALEASTANPFDAMDGVSESKPFPVMLDSLNCKARLFVQRNGLPPPVKERIAILPVMLGTLTTS